MMSNPEDDDVLGDDGYPSEQELNRIRAWPYNDLVGWFDYIKPRWNWAATKFVDNNPGLWVLYTGGWSGNEDIIRAMQANVVLWQICWYSNYKGGKYVFTNPSQNISITDRNCE